MTGCAVAPVMKGTIKYCPRAAAQVQYLIEESINIAPALRKRTARQPWRRTAVQVQYLTVESIKDRNGNMSLDTKTFNAFVKLLYDRCGIALG